MSGAAQKDTVEEERERMLFFRSGAELFTIPVVSVEEVVVGEEWTHVPLAPRGVIGIANHRGKIFTVVDFRRLAGLGEGDAAVGQAVFLHRSDMTVGFSVDAIEGIEWVPRRLLAVMTGPGGEGRQDFIRGLLDFDGRVAGVVDPEKFADTITRLPDEAGD